MNGGNNGWNEHQKLVLAEFERFNKWLEKLDEKIDKIEIKIAVMSVKQKAQMAIYGALGSAIPASIVLVYLILKSSA